jgi:hypothetical protein
MPARAVPLNEMTARAVDQRTMKDTHHADAI